MGHRKKGKIEMQRAISVQELMSMKKETYALSGAWADAFGEPEKHGVWFVWGQSGSGKTSFVLQMCKELCRFGKVAYDSLEEGSSLTMKNAFMRAGMQDVARRMVLLAGEPMDELDTRLSRRKSPDAVVIDSFQYTGMDFNKYLWLKRRHPNKLIVIISQADGTRPKGRTAVSVMYDAALKIWVEGYRAFSKGRYFGPKGYYTIWDERASEYWKDGNM